MWRATVLLASGVFLLACSSTSSGSGASSAGQGGTSSGGTGAGAGSASGGAGTGAGAGVGGGGVGGGAFDGSPTIGGCPVFPKDNAWNRDISGATAHPQASTWLANMGSANLRLDLGSTEEFYGIPFVVVPENQTPVEITYGVGGENYADESDPGPYPIPLDAPIEGGSSQDPDPTSGDRHVIAIQEGSCWLYELYATERTQDGFRCASSAKWHLTENWTRPAEWTSADAAGLPIFPGLLRWEEIEAGEIRHALRFTVPTVQYGYIAPASHFGSTQDTSYPPYGLRVRLAASFDDSAYSAEAKVVIAALKTYGMILADQGSSWFVSGMSHPSLAPLIDELHSTRPIPSSAFEVVFTEATTCGWSPPGGCL